MSYLSKLINKIKGIDPFYYEIKKDQIHLYQHYFSKLLNLVDLDTQTKWSQSKDYDKNQMEKDEIIMEKIATIDAAQENLAPVILQVMLNQYFFADVYLRERDKDNWANRVIYRKKIDYFPGGFQVLALLAKVTQ